jgi:hypothetical protein
MDPGGVAAPPLLIPHPVGNLLPNPFLVPLHGPILGKSGDARLGEYQ